MLEPSTNRALAARHASEASVAVVEGVMGLFDGVDGTSESGSTAEMAKWLDLPVVLVVDAWSMARSAAAMVAGYADFDEDLDVSGVIFNRIAGGEHLDLLRGAVEDSTALTVLGGLPKRDALDIPERHLGLYPASQEGLPEGYLEGWRSAVETHLDLDELLESSTRTLDFDEQEPSSRAPSTSISTDVRLGVAIDDAFCFYYRDNLSQLEAAGAEIVEFSPLAGEWPGPVDGLYLGGGYPELYAERLADRDDLRETLRQFATSGGPIYAECGGLMYLGETLESQSGACHEMCGVFPFETHMREHPRIDYAEVTARPSNPLFPAETTIRGHIFHQSEVVGLDDSLETSYDIEPRRHAFFEEGYVSQRTLASYVHLHFADHPRWVDTWLEVCRDT